MGELARRLVLTAEGRRVLVGAYLLAALVSIATYWITHSPAYALGQALVLGFALVWARWCLRRV